MTKCFELDITAKGFKYLSDSCERLKYVNIFDCRIHDSCPRYERIIENYRTLSKV